MKRSVDFMMLHHSFVGDDDAPRLSFVIHGVLGAGHNLRSFAKRLSEARPDHRFVLIDLRYHGRSLGAPPPHRLDSCVDDLFELAEHLGRAPRTVIGHSLGGKVALRYGRRHEMENYGTRRVAPELAGTLTQVWALDSNPGAQNPDEDHQVYQVLEALRRAPGPFSSRQEATAAIVAQGKSQGLANWLATSLERRPDGFHWRFDLDPIEELLSDYFALDEWPWIDNLSPDGRIRYELLVAENSDRWSGSMKERADGLNGAPRVGFHTLPDSGHWVHVDNPDGLLSILSKHLR